MVIQNGLQRFLAHLGGKTLGKLDLSMAMLAPAHTSQIQENTRVVSSTKQGFSAEVTREDGEVLSVSVSSLSDLIDRYS
ncbi:MAG: hypothetical protein C0621_00520 [Desulfuromonas sp.]|nr:MAG: hypothetical protein C0621_00520 [Desulfuromonas sp.]